MASENPALAALYFQIEPDNAMATIVDAAGYFHTAQSAAGRFRFNWGEDPTGQTGNGYAAMSAI